MNRLPVVHRSLPRTPWILVAAGTSAVSLLVAIVTLTGPGFDTEQPQALEPEMIVSESDEDGIEEGTEAVEAPILLPLVAYEVFLSRDPFEPVVEPDEPTAPVDVARPSRARRSMRRFSRSSVRLRIRSDLSSSGSARRACPAP